MERTARAALAPLLACCMLVFPGLAAPAAAQAEVDLALVLAVDISRSMDYDEQLIQRRGYADAFRHPEVLDAIRTGVTGRIAVTYVEWSGPGLQRVIVPWMIVDGSASAGMFADQLAENPIVRWQGTSISGGLMFAADLLRTSGYSPLRQVIDISGDGPNNMGLPVERVRDEVVGRGITINGLPIMLKRESDPFAGFGIDNLDDYYQSCVIGGAGSFIVPVTAAEELAEAIRRKMVLEIASVPVGPGYVAPDRIRVVPATEAPAVDCLIGEKLRRNFRP